MAAWVVVDSAGKLAGSPIGMDANFETFYVLMRVGDIRFPVAVKRSFISGPTSLPQNNEALFTFSQGIARAAYIASYGDL